MTGREGPIDTRSADTRTPVLLGVMATYEPAGEIPEGPFALEEPTEAELRRRQKLREE